jgi:hypothetical protein
VTLSVGTVPGAGLRVIKSLASDVDTPGKLAYRVLVERARVEDGADMLRLLTRLQDAGWLVMGQVQPSTGRPNLVTLTDDGLQLARRLGWDRGTP